MCLILKNVGPGMIEHLVRLVDKENSEEKESF
jgi:hypothetical protein